jgi:hypothetical protein
MKLYFLVFQFKMAKIVFCKYYGFVVCHTFKTFVNVTITDCWLFLQEHAILIVLEDSVLQSGLC